jgi:hypothetical protein
MARRPLVCITLMSLMTCVPLRAQVELLRINEFMALNSTTVRDGDGDFSDWIEIYNPTSSAVGLLNWSLTDEKENLQKWKFPNIGIPAGGYIIVFASGKDRSAAEFELHSNFQLRGAGEYLALCDPAGGVVTEFTPEYQEQHTDRSFAYFDGIYMETTIPTPGGVNMFPESQRTPAPVFSHRHGFYDAPFEVTVGSQFGAANIYYTTDGSEPGEVHGILYTSPVPVSTTTVLRAVAVQPGLMTSTITTSTYIFVSDVVNQPTTPPGYPVRWGPYTAIPDTAIADYEMDPEITQDPKYAGLMKEALLSIPTMSIVTDTDNLFLRNTDPAKGGIYIYTGPPGNGDVPQLGIDWARPASVEYFDRNGSESFQEDCELKIHGGHSRRPEKSPKHSFRITFKKPYGNPKLDYPLFGDGGTSSFNSLILRATYGNTWLHMSNSERNHTQLIHDIWAKDTQLDMGHLSGHGTNVHLYINGLYWGIYNPTERIDKNFAATYIGGSEDDYDVIKDYAEVVDGNITAWNTLRTLVGAGMSDDANYQRIQGKNPDGTENPELPAYLDAVNFIDYMILNYYGANWDWDHHNWIGIRNRVRPGKGFQFFSWDAEHVCENASSSVLNKNNDGRPTWLFQRLCENADFRRLFADRVQLHCFYGGALTPSAAVERWMKRAGEIDLAIIAESARWGDYRRDVHPYAGGPYILYDKNHWLVERSFMVNEYFPARTDVFISQLRAGGLFPITDAPRIMINGLPYESPTLQTGDVLSFASSSGSIYYTLDDTDPLLDGHVAQQAVLYTGPIALLHSIRLKTRSLNGSEWSALVDVLLTVPGDLNNVKITELHYHPQAQDSVDDRSYEFVELKNIGSSQIDVGGSRFIEGISCTIPSPTIVEPQGFVVLVSDTEQFSHRYGSLHVVPYDGSLDNGGELLLLLSAHNDTLISVRYNDKAPWPEEADGAGYSLVSKDPSPEGDPNDPSYWRPSARIHGSPAADDIFTEIEAQSSVQPKSFRLYQNYPNPFNPSTEIMFDLPAASYISLIIYDVVGREISALVDGNIDAGCHVLQWNASAMAGGIYFARLTVYDQLGNLRYGTVNKLLLVK